jgi:hypothetical protein
MRTATALVFALALPFTAFAQTQKPDSTTTPGSAGAAPGSPAASQQYGQGGSAHCDQMTGSARAQCLKDEGAKTDSRGAAAGGSTASRPEQDPNATNRERPGQTPSTR